MLVALQVVCVITSVLMIAGVLAHRGSGGGLSDLLGAGASPAASSAHANRNLTRLTLAVTALWAIATIALAVLSR